MKKAKKLKWIDLVDKDTTNTESTEFPGNCGIQVLHCLDDISPFRQAQSIVTDGFGIYDIEDCPESAQVVFSDVIGSKKWKKAKSLSFKGPISLNPNSGNKIQVYIFPFNKRNLLALANSK